MLVTKLEHPADKIEHSGLPTEVVGAAPKRRDWWLVSCIGLSAVLIIIMATLYTSISGKVEKVAKSESALRQATAKNGQEQVAAAKQNKLSAGQVVSLQQDLAIAVAESKPVKTDKFTPDEEPDLSKYYDAGFSVISPFGGTLMHTSGDLETFPVGFSWYKNKYATSYAIQIRYISQTEYNDAVPANLTKVYASASDQPAYIQLGKDWPIGDYQWRVQAKTAINGKETVIQSTPDLYFQVMQ